MPLTLRITGPQASRLAERATRVFGVHGGRIGRASDNDWVLPDPHRFLSGYHALIEYRGGKWTILDTSSNGTFLNEALTPLGRNAGHVLRNGDHVRLGEYDISVEVTADTDLPLPDDGEIGLGMLDEEEFALATHGDLGAELDMKSLLSDPNPPADDSPPVPLKVSDAYGQAVMRARARPSSRPTAAPAAPQRATTMVPFHSGPVQAFFRGAGLDPTPLSSEQATAALVLAGQLLREMALGLIASQQHRREQKGHYKLTDTARTPVEQNPFRVADSVDDVLTRLFGPRSARFLTPLEAVRASFGDLTRHEQATQVATQDALASYVKRLAPEDLERQFGESLAHGNGSMEGNAGERYWQMYAELYRVLAQTGPEGLPRTFVEEFAKAYEVANAELRERDQRSRLKTRKPQS